MLPRLALGFQALCPAPGARRPVRGGSLVTPWAMF